MHTTGHVWLEQEVVTEMLSVLVQFGSIQTESQSQCALSSPTMCVTAITLSKHGPD